MVDFDGDGVLSYGEFKMCFMENISAMQTLIKRYE